MTKRFFSLFFTLMLTLGAITATAASANAEYTLITDPDAVKGSDFTDSPYLADKLDSIIDGDAGIYRDSACTIPVDTTLGTSPVRNNGIYMFVEPVDGMATNIGTSCWIYANGVYYTLFGEATGNGAGENSEKLDLSGTWNRALSYENFTVWGVRQGVGALVRASGHSMIVLGYDENTLTVLDGNGNGAGLVAIREYPWDYLGSYVEYIIQPKEAHYTALYTSGPCGESINWALDDTGTLTISGSGSIQYPGWWDYKEQVNRLVIDGENISIGAGCFSNCKNLQEIVFSADIATLADNAFMGVSGKVLYPASGSGWIDAASSQYGGNVTWEPYGMTQLQILTQPKAVYDQTDCATVRIVAEGDGLRYNWYLQDAQGEISKVTEGEEAYCQIRQIGAQVMCIIQDQYGNVVMSESITV